MPPKRKAAAASTTTASPKKKTTAASETSDSKKKKDAPPAAVVEAKEAWTKRGLAMGFKESDMGVQYVLKPGESFGDDEDEDGGTVLTTKAQFAKTLALVTSKHWADEMTKVTAAFLRATGNSIDDGFMMLNTHSGNMAIEFLAKAGRRLARLVKKDPPQAFWETFSLLQTMLDHSFFMHDNEFDAEEFAGAMRDVAAASRAVLRAPLEALKVDEINLSVFKVISDRVGKMINEQSPMAEQGVTVKWN